MNIKDANAIEESDHKIPCDATDSQNGDGALQNSGHTDSLNTAQSNKNKNGIIGTKPKHDIKNIAEVSSDDTQTQFAIILTQLTREIVKLRAESKSTRSDVFLSKQAYKGSNPRNMTNNTMDDLNMARQTPQASSEVAGNFPAETATDAARHQKAREMAVGLTRNINIRWK